MASEEAQMNSADSAQKDIQGAIQMGREAAKSIKTVKKAATLAASQNYVGAALELLKDPETLKKIIIILLIPLLFFGMVTVMFLHSLPTVIFESVESFFSKVEEDWKTAVYSGGGNVFWRSIWATITIPVNGVAQIVDAAATSVWTWVKNLLIVNDPVDGREDIASSIDTQTDNGEELHVISEGVYYVQNSSTGEMEAVLEGAEYNTLVNKIDACVKKIDARATTIKDAITSKSYAIKTAVNSYYEDGYYSFNTVINIETESLSQTGAIQLLSLYTVQTGASLQDMRLSDFMKWLGWNGNNLGTTTFNLSNIGVSPSVKTWKGTFVPQYIFDMIQYEKEQKAINRNFVQHNFDSHKCAAVDLILVVDCPLISEIPVTSVPVYTIDPLTGQDVYLGEAGTAHLNITIRPRTISGLIDLAGLWEGAAP